ncbi:MAG: hypothetical protein ACKPIX_17550, partial [Dolichospermum sp.]
MALWDTVDSVGRVRMQVMFAQWKAIAQLVPRSALALRQRRQSRKAVLDFVYRSGRHALEDWSGSLQAAFERPPRGGLLEHLSFAARLKVDFFDRVLTHGTLCSLPALAPALVDGIASAMPLENADAALHAAAPSLVFMEVVETRVRRRRVARTARTIAREAMWCPVAVQLYEPVPMDTIAGAGPTLVTQGPP